MNVPKTNMAKLSQALCILACLFIAGCFDAKNEEWLAPDVTQKHLTEISSLTQIKLPEGTTGLAYFYVGSGRDDSLAAKLKIPAEKVNELLANPIFKTGKDEHPGNGVGTHIDWWDVDTLSEPVHRTADLNSGSVLGCAFGKDGKDYILYITWYEL